MLFGERGGERGPLQRRVLFGTGKKRGEREKEGGGVYRGRGRVMLMEEGLGTGGKGGNGDRGKG